MVDSLFPILGWLRILEFDAVHLAKVHLLVPFEGGMSVPHGDIRSLQAILLKNVKKWLVATKLDGTQLVIVPMVLENVLDVVLTLALRIKFVDLRTRRTNEGAIPN